MKIKQLVLVKWTLIYCEVVYRFVTWNSCCKGLRLMKFMVVVNNFVDIWFLLFASAASAQLIRFYRSYRRRTLNKVSETWNSDDMAVQQLHYTCTCRPMLLVILSVRAIMNTKQMAYFVEWIVAFLATKPFELFGLHETCQPLVTVFMFNLSLDALCTSDCSRPNASNGQIISEEWFRKKLFVC